MEPPFVLCMRLVLWVLRRMLDAAAPFPYSAPVPGPPPSSPTAHNSEVNLFFIRAALLLPVDDDDDDAEYRIPSTRCAVLGPASHRDIYLFSFLQAEFSVEPQLLHRRRRRRWVLCFI